MKHMKRIFALALAVMMLLSLAITASAVNITIDDDDVTGAEYKAYKLLNATDGGNGKFAYTLNPKYETALKTVTGKNTEAEIIDHISKLDKDGIRTFADAVYALVKDMTEDAAATNNVFTGLDQGYYLIVETATGSVGDFDEDTFSLVMLDTAGKENIEVKTKEELPQSEKKVKDVNDSTGEVTKYNDSEWIDSADHDIGDDVPFQITFTLPTDFANYETYYVGIHDKQSAGLDPIENLKVTVGGTDITGWFTKSVSTGDGCSFHISCDDIIAKAKTANVTLSGGDKIVFEYTAKLNANAQLGATGNPNDMTVEFSNNPYGDGTSKTPWDRVIVFTYKVNVDKYTTVDEKEVALNGANFTLYKEVPEGTKNPLNENEVAQTGAAIKAALKGTNAAIKADALDDATYYIVVTNKTGDANGSTFEFKGVDDGNYVLVETTIPDGYNAWESVAFKITAAHDVHADTPTLISLTGGDLVTGDFKDTGFIATKIENNSGVELPSTGGMGTTIFYVLGGMMVLAAVVLLVTKKRMASAE